jgi:hypothetical protein
MTDPVLPDLVAKMGIAVIERLSNGSFNPIAALPDWLGHAFDAGAHGPTAALATALPFLDEFLPQAEDAWYKRSGPLVSSPFVATIAGADLLLRATALTRAGRSFLVLERLTGDADTRPILQKAREAELERERMLTQIDRVRVQVATIARDLDRLAGAELTDSERQLVENLRQSASASRAALDALPSGPRARGRKERSHLS